MFSLLINRLSKIPFSQNFKGQTTSIWSISAYSTPTKLCFAYWSVFLKHEMKFSALPINSAREKFCYLYEIRGFGNISLLIINHLRSCSHSALIQLIPTYILLTEASYWSMKWNLKHFLSIRRLQSFVNRTHLWNFEIFHY